MFLLLRVRPGGVSAKVEEGMLAIIWLRVYWSENINVVRRVLQALMERKNKNG